jgi:putative ABC transport system substrate-binding protein
MAKALRAAQGKSFLSSQLSLCFGTRATPVWRSKQKRLKHWQNRLALSLQDRGVKDPNELDTVFAVMTKDRPDGFLALMDPVLNAYRKRIIDFLAQNRYAGDVRKQRLGRSWRSYIIRSPVFSATFRRAAVLMDKVLKGIKPSEIPVEQATEF